MDGQGGCGQTRGPDDLIGAMSRQGLGRGEMGEVGEKPPGDERPPHPCSWGSRWVIQCS